MFRPPSAPRCCHHQSLRGRPRYHLAAIICLCAAARHHVATITCLCVASLSASTPLSPVSALPLSAPRRHRRVMARDSKTEHSRRNFHQTQDKPVFLESADNGKTYLRNAALSCVSARTHDDENR
jgi:hypothetical protein